MVLGSDEEISVNHERFRRKTIGTKQLEIHRHLYAKLHEFSVN